MGPARAAAPLIKNGNLKLNIVLTVKRRKNVYAIVVDIL